MIKKDDDKFGYWISKTLVLSFGIILIFNSVFLLFFSFFITGYGLALMELLSRMILAGIFLTIGIGLILFLQSPGYNEKKEFCGDLKEMHSCLLAEETLITLDILQIKEQLGIGPEEEKEQT
jgi:hypothetical protein